MTAEAEQIPYPVPPNTNPRYWAYAVAHGADSVDEMKARDRKRWPGGIMCGFITWNMAHLATFCREQSRPRNLMSEQDQADYTAWLLDLARAARDPAAATERCHYCGKRLPLGEGDFAYLRVNQATGMMMRFCDGRCDPDSEVPRHV